jgi:hypothetical protein
MNGPDQPNYRPGIPGNPNPLAATVTAAVTSATEPAATVTGEPGEPAATAVTLTTGNPSAAVWPTKDRGYW